MMMPERENHSSEQQCEPRQKDVLADQIMQLLQDIGFLPRKAEGGSVSRLGDDA